MSWPGKWHSKAEGNDSQVNDNGIILISGETYEEYMWFDPDGYDPRTEVRR